MIRLRRLLASFATLGIVAMALVLTATGGALALTTTWDAAGDFSASSNPSGAWSYGWSASRGSAFNVDTFASTMSGLNIWNYSSSQVEPDVIFNPTGSTISQSGTNFIPANSIAFHPGPNGQNAVARWTAPNTGSYTITATFTGLDQVGPTTTDVAVLSNGTALWSGDVTGYLATQSFAGGPLNLSAGDTVDFTVGFGTDGTYNYDTTGLRAGIAFVGDTTPPVVTLTTPAQGATYTLNQSVMASYSCTDPDSTSFTCVGPAANGSPIDTTSTGTKTFTVAAADQANNTASASATYAVGYGVCWLYDQTKAVESGAAIPIKLALCDAANVDQSSPGITVTAAAVTETTTGARSTVQFAGSANPDNIFRFSADLGTSGGYIFNLKTDGLTTGVYALSFSVSGDPTTHTALFAVN